MDRQPFGLAWHRRGLLTFSLRTMLAVVTLCGFALGWWIGLARQQQSEVLALQQAAASSQIQYDIQWTAGASDLASKSWAPRQLLERLGPDFFHNVVEADVHFVGDTMFSAGLEALVKLTRLECVAIRRAAVYDRELSRLAELPRLRSLEVNAWNMTDEGVRNLAPARRLESLVLHDAWDITDQGVAELCALPRLETLEIHRATITAAGIRHLARLPELRSLALTGRHIGDDVIAPLAQLVSLERLDLSSAVISADTLLLLNALPRLRELILTDGVTGNTAELATGLPKCKIVGLARRAPIRRSPAKAVADHSGRPLPP